MKKYVVAISMDKVQTFLYEAIHGKTQEMQTEHKTLTRIVQSSKEISIEFKNTIEKNFPKEKMYIILECSGVLIFQIEWEKDEIAQALRKIFEHYYRKFNGQALVTYAYFEYSAYMQEGEEKGKLIVIQKSKEMLKSKTCINSIIKDNRKLLFEFQEVKQAFNKELGGKELNCYEEFASTIDELRDEEEKKVKVEEENKSKRFRIAIIKGDLDGIGKLFANLENYTMYRKISKILYETITIETLHKEYCQIKEENPHFKVFPLYVAGDDLFFAVSTSGIVFGVELCKRILNKIKNEIQEELPEYPMESLTMSVGIEFSYNSEPIRYYYERVEEQLRIAKKENYIEALQKYQIMRIAINKEVFFYFDEHNMKEFQKELLKKEKKKVLHWNHLLHDGKMLDYIKASKYSKDLGTASFFHGLLEKVKNIEIKDKKDERKYVNMVLYHLMPQFLKNGKDDHLISLELYLHVKMIRKLFVQEKTKNERTKKEETKYFFNVGRTRETFEKYISLLLLFSDSRFNVAISKYDENTLKNQIKNNQNDIKRFFFNKPIAYLYAYLNGGPLKNVFAKQKGYKPEGYKGNRDVFIYQKLNIEKSMFFRIKNRMEKKHIAFEDIANTIHLVNDQGEKAIKEFNDNREKEGKAPYALYFNKDKFCKNEKFFTKDYIDTLLIFYQYDELNMQYKMWKKRIEEPEYE